MSPLPPETLARLARLPAQAIAGTLAPGAEGPEGFTPNPAFVACLHAVIRAHAPADPATQAAARAQAEGWVYVIDLRTPDGPQGRVPMEDIIGGFQVTGGAILPDRYWENAGYAVLTRQGLVQLGPGLQPALLAALAA